MPVRLKDPLWKCEQDALDLLEKNKIKGVSIIRVDSQAILFEQEKTAWTAWLDKDRRSILRLDRGFVADF